MVPSPMQPPQRIDPRSLADYLEIMCKAVFQSGMSWKVVESKWPGTRAALHNFDPKWISGMSEAELDALTADSRVIRNRRKLEAIVTNAQRMLELDAEHGGFRNYLRSHSESGVLIDDIHRQFKFMGEMGTFYWLYVVGEDVPDHEEFQRSRAAHS